MNSILWFDNSGTPTAIHPEISKIVAKNEFPNIVARVRN